MTDKRRIKDRSQLGGWLRLLAYAGLKVIFWLMERGE